MIKIGMIGEGLTEVLEERKKELKRDEESGCEKRKKKSKGEEMNWQLRKGKNVKLEKQLRNNVKNKEKRMKFETFKLNTLETKLLSWPTLKSAKKFWKACRLKKLPRWMQMKLWLSKLKNWKKKRKNCKYD